MPSISDLDIMMKMLDVLDRRQTTNVSSSSVGDKQQIIMIADRINARVSEFTLEDSSVSIGGNVVGSSIVTGDHNVITTTTTTKTTLPPSESVDIEAEVAALRALLAEIASEDRLVIDNAMTEVAHHLGKAEPDKDAIGGTLERALGYASNAADFADSVEKLAPHVRNASAWLGANWYKLLGFVDLAI